MATTKLLTLKAEHQLSNPIGVWDINGRLIIAQESDEGEVSIAEALVFRPDEEAQLLALLTARDAARRKPVG